MEFFEVMLLMVPPVVIAIGWFVNSALDRRNERYIKLEDLRQRFLANAYLELCRFATRAKSDPKNVNLAELNSVFAKVYLYGDEPTIKELRSIDVEKGASGRAKIKGLSNLMDHLRRQLRSEIGLSVSVDDTPGFALNMTRKPKAKPMTPRASGKFVGSQPDETKH